MTPELVLTESFRRVLDTIYSQGELSRVAIDEAHCISEWGHDFRKAYCQLSHFRSAYPKVPIICLTATATPSIRADVIRIIGMDPAKTKTFIATTTRRNLIYEVRFTSDEGDDRFTWLLSWLQKIYARRANDPARSQEIAQESENNKRPDAISGIIYVPYRSDCDTLSSRLRKHSIGAAAYHAGLNNMERATCQSKWIANTPGYDIIVATTAFGMGIDKQDVRFVVHWSLPKSFEGYYQEAGRAGRDGRIARCLLFYSREDRDRVGYRMSRDTGSGNGNGDSHGSRNQAAKNKEIQMKPRAESFQALVKYCEQTDRCRHMAIGEFFGEEGVKACNGACDFCMDGEGLKRRKRDGLASEVSLVQGQLLPSRQ